MNLLDRGDGKRGNREWCRVVNKRWCYKLDRCKWSMCSVMEGGVMEVGVDSRSVVSKVEEVGGCVGYVVVSKCLGGWEGGSRVVDHVLVGRMHIGENLTKVGEENIFLLCKSNLRDSVE